MSYSGIVAMAGSVSLRDRIVAAAAEQGVENPQAWTGANLWAVVNAPGWDDDWQFAVDNATVNVNPDTGARDDVINDAKILAAVQARIAELAG